MENYNNMDKGTWDSVDAYKNMSKNEDNKPNPNPDDYQYNAENDFLTQNAKSSVKIKHTTRGVSFEIKVVSGEEDIIENLKNKALEQYNSIKSEIY